MRWSVAENRAHSENQKCMVRSKENKQGKKNQKKLIERRVVTSERPARRVERGARSRAHGSPARRSQRADAISAVISLA